MAALQKIVKLFNFRHGQVSPEHLNIARQILNQSGVIALPTDTLYGIAAKANDSKALDRIYKIKGRNTDKPLAVCVADVDNIKDVADIGTTSMKVFKSLLPGPITIVLKRSENLNKDLNPNVGTIGVRVPSHNFIMALCSELGPLALTSANKSGGESPLAVEDFRDIWDELDCVFDSGPVRQESIENSKIVLSQRAGSTVVDLTDQDKKCYKVIREGCALNRTINTLTRFGYIRKQ